MIPGYTEYDQQRWFAEPAKFAGDAMDLRTPFARDRARVLHSAALRRLAGKTQVIGPGEGDVPRTRLTHSLEVAQIGRAIGGELGADPDIVDTAGLAHDIGHPPFGHNGEQVLAELAESCGGFEGNAQTLRILTRLEPKALTDAGESSGLNLTRACLDAVCKYPWQRRNTTKFGVYEDDVVVFEWMRGGISSDKRCLEAQIMDWADDVGYCVHDLEDGIATRRISLRVLADRQERQTLVELAAQHFTAEPTPDLQDAVTRLLKLPFVVSLIDHDYDGSFAAQVQLKQLTSELVGRYVSAVVAETRLMNGNVPLTRYMADLIIPPQFAAEVALLKALALRYVMCDPARLAVQRRERELLAEVFAFVCERTPDSLDPMFRSLWKTARHDSARLRVVVDQMASLTNDQVIRWRTELVHGRMPVSGF